MAGAGHVTSPPGRKPAARNRKIYRQTVPAPSAKRQRRGHGRTSTHARNSTDEQTDRPSTPTTTSHSYGRWSTGSGQLRLAGSPATRGGTGGPGSAAVVAHYRTTGLRLLARSGGKVLLVHDGWSPRTGTVIVLSEDDQLGWEFSR